MASEKRNQKRGEKQRQRRALKRRRGDQRVRESSAAKKRSSLRDRLARTYALVDLETTCCRQCVCCTVACPQMNDCEARQILDRVWHEWSKSRRNDLIMTAMRYFCSNSMVKPCPMLGTMPDGLSGCLIYEDRPLNCRVYGQWPAEAYEQRVQRFVEATGLERSDLPLNVQCPHVRRKSELPLTTEVLDQVFAELDKLDQKIGGYKEEEIAQRKNYRTLHDWLLYRVLGEDRLVMLTDFLLAATPEEVEDYLRAYEQELRSQE